MPKIIIREYDKTKASSTAYNNFAVLVPGFCASGSDASVFDENGVYECGSQAEFVKNIGKAAATDIAIVTAAKAPELKSDIEVSAENFVDLRASGTLYYAMKKEEGNTDIGYLENASYKYELVPSLEEFKESFEVADGEPSGYAIIESGKEGADEVRVSQMGNQIAYELLGLGYTVLFKNINTASVAELASEEFWEPLKDKAAYDFRYIIAGLSPMNQSADAVNKVNDAIIGLADMVNAKDLGDTGRGDCTALVDICSAAYSQVDQSTAIKNIKTQVDKLKASKYAAAFAPYVTYSMVEDDIYKNTTFPASFHYLACVAKAAENYNEWYAIAGYDRGISNYKIDSTGCKFGDIAINELCPRNNAKVTKAVNVIAKIKNNYYLWGNRTLNALGEDLIASDFLNIRQLCTSIKKQVYVACRKFTFDPNSDVLWINFQNAVRPLLEKMKADQGISEYKFIKCKTDKKAVLMAKLRIVPIEAVEDFEIDLTLENSITGTSVSIAE